MCAVYLFCVCAITVCGPVRERWVASARGHVFIIYPLASLWSFTAASNAVVLPLLPLLCYDAGGANLGCLRQAMGTRTRPEERHVNGVHITPPVASSNRSSTCLLPP